MLSTILMQIGIKHTKQLRNLGIILSSKLLQMGIREPAVSHALHGPTRALMGNQMFSLVDSSGTRIPIFRIVLYGLPIIRRIAHVSLNFQLLPGLGRMLLIGLS